MRRIQQRHKSTCAVAAIAMLSGCSYKKIFNVVYGSSKQKEYFGLSFEKICRALHKLKVAYKASFDKKDLLKLNSDALITVHINVGGKVCRHAVVWCNSKKSIIDPYPSKLMPIKIDKKYCLKNFSLLIEIV